MVLDSRVVIGSCMLMASETAKKRVTYTSIFLTCIPVLRCIVRPSQARLFRVPKFSHKIVEIERFALRADILHECQSYLGSRRARFGRKRQKYFYFYFSRPLLLEL